MSARVRGFRKPTGGLSLSTIITYIKLLILSFFYSSLFRVVQISLTAFAYIALPPKPRRKCNIGEFSEEEIARGNAFVDDLLEDMLDDHGDEYDPYKMGDSAIGFSRKILFVNVSGEAKLSNGYITGLKSLHRSGDCSLTREGDRIRVLADLGAGVLDFYYSGTVKFMTMGPTISVHGVLAYVELTMEFTVDESTGKNAELKEFYTDDLRGMEISITGLGPLNWAMNTFLSAIKYIFSGYIKNIVEGQVRGYISRRMREYQFPVVVTPTH